MKRQSHRRNLGVGIRWGVGFAVGFSILATVIGLVALVTEGGDVKELGSTLLFLTGAYFAAGLVAGAAVGVLLPMGRTAVGAGGLGFIGAALVYGTIGLLITPPARWWPVVPLMAIVCGLLAGPAFGYLVWRDERRGKR